MNKLNLWVGRAVVFASALVLSAGASAVTFTVDANNKITGAQNVAVTLRNSVSFYDVAFGDTIATLPTFMNLSFARAASQALVDQVFVAAAPGSLDNNPSVMLGCESTPSCFAFTKHTTYLDLRGGYALARNYGSSSVSSLGQDDVFSTVILSDNFFNDLGGEGFTVAHWTVSAVPEPGTYALMLAGLGLIGAVARRRKAKQTP